MGSIQLNVVTPLNSFFSGKVDSVIVRTTEGDIGFMKNHLPFVAGLNIGFLRIVVNGEEKKAISTNGFVKFIDDEINILTDYCEWVQDIDKSVLRDTLQKFKTVDTKNMSDTDKDINAKNIKTYEKLLKLLA